MAQIIGTTTITGITSSVTNRRLGPLWDYKTGDALFASGAIGYSTIGAAAGQTWHLIVYTQIANTDVPMAGLSSLGVLSTTGFIPLLRADGTTQTNYLGVPRPSRMDLIGSSAGVGITFGLAVGFNFINTP